MSTPELPEPWAAAMVAAGFVDNRYRDLEIPSAKRLAEAAGLHTSTVTAAIFGRTATSPETVERLADALRVPVTKVAAWVGRARDVRPPYVPPKEADYLNERQRRAVDELILSIVIVRPENDLRGSLSAAVDDALSDFEDGGGFE